MIDKATLVTRQEEMKNRLASKGIQGHWEPQNSRRKYPTMQGLYYQKLIEKLPNPLSKWPWDISGIKPTKKGSGYISFMSKLEEILPFLDDEWGEGKLSQLRMVPDGYYIDEERERVYVLEIEDHHPLSRDDSKLSRFAELGFMLDYYYWNMIVIMYSPHYNVVQVFDCFELWLNSECPGATSWSRNLNLSKLRLEDCDFATTHNLVKN